MILSQLSFLSLPYTRFKKNIFEFEILNVNTLRFVPCWIRLKMCAEMKDRLRHITLGLSWLFQLRFRNIQNTDSLIVSFAAARAGVTQRSPSHAAASNRHTFLSRNKRITVRLSFSWGGSCQKCQPITWLLLFAKRPSSLSGKRRIVKTGVQSCSKKKFSTPALNSHQKLAISKLIEGRKVFSLHRTPSRVNSNP